MGWKLLHLFSMSPAAGDSLDQWGLPLTGDNPALCDLIQSANSPWYNRTCRPVSAARYFFALSLPEV
ncbi:hypothetical protein KCP73_15845 [Salmonella enterica subsp. enterica]|nr:hypothetical protein KCP73_15845 [Salmonella enterica subsp. enterica]